MTMTQNQISRTIAKQGLDLIELEAAYASEEVRIERVKVLFDKVLADDDLGWGLYIATSGGKDSVVVTDLAFKFIKPNLPVIHTPKQEVVTSTREFLYTRDFPILYIKAKDMGQYPDLRSQIDGTRKAEFNRTDGRSTNVIIDGESVSRDQMTETVRNGLFGLNMVFPIFDWSDAEVWAYIFKNKIDFTPEYFE